MNYEEISFGIISYAGDAFATLREAISAARNKNFEQADKLMQDAKKSLGEAHSVHTKLIVAEADGTKPEYSILLSHAQDTMMNALLFETITEEFIEMYKQK
ncbi:MAG: PTS lactose/cellobiose transporter subunit IIA [Clostridium sp.]